MDSQHNTSSRLSLLTAFQPHPSSSTRQQPRRRAQSPSTPSSSPSPNRRSRSPWSLSSSSTSPNRNRRSCSSNFFTHLSSSTSRYILRRRPSTIDLALEEERRNVESQNLLSVFEPRPVPLVPVTVGGSEIWDGSQSQCLSFSPSTSTRSSLYLRSAVIGTDSPIDEDDEDPLYLAGCSSTMTGVVPGTTIEARLFDSPSRAPPPMSLGASMFGAGGMVEHGSFVMDSIFEVMESGH